MSFLLLFKSEYFLSLSLCVCLFFFGVHLSLLGGMYCHFLFPMPIRMKSLATKTWADDSSSPHFKCLCAPPLLIYTHSMRLQQQITIYYYLLLNYIIGFTVQIEVFVGNVFLLLPKLLLVVFLFLCSGWILSIETHSTGRVRRVVELSASSSFCTWQQKRNKKINKERKKEKINLFCSLPGCSRDVTFFLVRLCRLCVCVVCWGFI